MASNGAQSIYLKNDYSKVTTVGDWIGAYGLELETVERLITMGYRFSNSVPLGKRAEWLENRIDQLHAVKHPEWPSAG